MDQNIHSTQRVDQGSLYAQNRINAQRAGGVDFSKILDAQLGEVKFSAHAESRLKSRNIDMTPEIRQKLNQAVTSAHKKGAKDSLVLLSDLAFIVNVPSRTVVTAMDGDSVRDNVFTNIDSTVIAG